MSERTVRLAQVGGALGFFGGVHRESALLAYPDVWTVASALHPDPTISIAQGQEWGIQYPCASIEELIHRKAELGLAGAMIAVPNNLHFPMARDLAQAGFHGYLEKPITTTVEEARELLRLIKGTGTVWGVNFTYAGNPTWRKARQIVLGGGIGKVRSIRLRYLQGWLWKEAAAWRKKKATSGFFGGLADIGSHCVYSLMFLLDQQVRSVQCRYRVNVPGRELDDEGDIWGETMSCVPFNLHVTQVDQLCLNDHDVDIIGSAGTIRISQTQTEHLVVGCTGEGERLFHRGVDYSKDPTFGKFFPEVDPDWRRYPGNHPESFEHAIARNVRNWGKAVRAKVEGVDCPADALYPTLRDGAHVMEVLWAAKVSADDGSSLVDVANLR